MCVAEIGDLHKSDEPDDLDQPPSRPPPPPPTDDAPGTQVTRVTIVTETRQVTTKVETDKDGQTVVTTTEVETSKDGGPVVTTTEVESSKEGEAEEKPEIEDLDITEVMEEMKLPPRGPAPATNTEEPQNEVSDEAATEKQQETLETAVQLLDQAETLLPPVKIEPIGENFDNEMDEQMSKTDRKTAACMPLSAGLCTFASSDSHILIAKIMLWKTLANNLSSTDLSYVRKSCITLL